VFKVGTAGSFSQKNQWFPGYDQENARREEQNERPKSREESCTNMMRLKHEATKSRSEDQWPESTLSSQRRKCDSGGKDADGGGGGGEEVERPNIIENDSQEEGETHVRKKERQAKGREEKKKVEKRA